MNPIQIWRDANVAIAPSAPAQLGTLERLAVRIATSARGVPDFHALMAAGMRVGASTAAERGVILDPAFCWLLEIGEHCTFAPYSTVLAHDASTRRSIGHTRLGRVRIGDRVFIGAHAVILPGVAIGDDAVIGAGAVVTRDVAPGTVAAGVPAREVMAAEAYAERHRQQMSERPVWSLQWTRAGGINDQQKEAMRAALADGEGYIE